MYYMYRIKNISNMLMSSSVGKTGSHVDGGEGGTWDQGGEGRGGVG